MIIIGICDDMETERKNVYHICERFFAKENIKHDYIFFKSGEEVLIYSDNIMNRRIDLLFLDVEMGGISGLELKERVLRRNMIWRIAFITSHVENIHSAFSQKTIGFISKPVEEDKIYKMINIVLYDLKENICLTFRGFHGQILNVKVSDIAYLEAKGSYTDIYTYTYEEGIIEVIISSKKIGQYEKELKDYNFIRVHKSFIVNLANISEITNTIHLRDINMRIPIGRYYRKITREQYLQYGSEVIKRRL